MREFDLSTGPRGLALRVCAWGEASGRATVIAHGFLEQGAAWDRVARALPGRVVAPDHRGHGLSGHAPGFYHFWDYVSDLDALVAHLGGPVDLVGHSMGGTIATLFAATRPDAVRRLVLVEGLGPPDVTERAVDNARRFLDAMRTPPVHRPMADVAEAADRMRRFNPRLPADEALRLAGRITRPHPEGVVWTWDPLHRARSPQPFSAPLFRRYLAAVTAPTLLVRGADSAFLPPDHAERAACLPDARELVLDGAGHLVHHDRPDALARAVRSHFS